MTVLALVGPHFSGAVRGARGVGIGGITLGLVGKSVDSTVAGQAAWLLGQGGDYFGEGFNGFLGLSI